MDYEPTGEIDNKYKFKFELWETTMKRLPHFCAFQVGKHVREESNDAAMLTSQVGVGTVWRLMTIW